MDSEHEIQPSNAGNTTPSDLVQGGNIPFGVQSEPETGTLESWPGNRRRAHQFLLI